jgi:hypothetical protein
MLRLKGPTQAAKATASALYFAFLLISLFTVAFEWTLPPHDHSGGFYHDRGLLVALVVGYHTIYINPVLSIAAIASLFPQAREILAGRRGSTEALSIPALAIQAITFAVAGVTWGFRLTTGEDNWQRPSTHVFLGWYELVGWAAVDNIIFAIVQMLLFLLAWKRKGPQDDAQETRPLLE